MTQYHLDPHIQRADIHRQLIINHIRTTVSLLGRSIQEMAQEAQSAGKAKWSEAEVDALVDYLHEHRSERADGGNFKDVTYSAAATMLQPLLVSGRPKDTKSVKYKWSAVSRISAFVVRS